MSLRVSGATGKQTCNGFQASRAFSSAKTLTTITQQPAGTSADSDVTVSLVLELKLMGTLYCAVHASVIQHSEVQL